MPKNRKEYLGDGAYVSEDGHGGIRITAENGLQITDEVSLGVSEIVRLVRFLTEGGWLS